MLRKKNVLALTKENAPKERRLKVRVVIKIERGERVDGSYDSSSDLASIELNKSLISTTDSKMRSIMDEVSGIVETQFEDIENQLNASTFLTEGFWSENKKEDVQPDF